MRRLLAGLAVTVLTGAAAVLLTSSPASATTLCTKQLSLSEGSGVVAYVPGTGSTYKCSLFEGDNSAAVKTLQHAINACYIANSKDVLPREYGITQKLSEDGDFGSKTKAALEAVQKWEVVLGYPESIDGNYGRQTYAGMSFSGTGLGTNDCWVPSSLHSW